MKKIYLLILLALIGIKVSLAQPSAQTDPDIYVCGPCNGSCDNLQFDKPGKCPHCGMVLVKTKLSDFKKQLALKPVTICFYLQDGVEVLDFAGPMEVFIAAGFNVFTVSKNYKPLRAQTILFVTPDYTVDDAPPADILAVFGGDTGPGVIDSTVIAWIKKQKVQSYFSVCTGAFILGKAGLLDNLTATTYHLQIENLQKAYPKTKVLANTRFVDNGSVITTAGISAGIDGALHVVEKLRGRAYARGVAEAIEYDKWVPENGLVINK
ncbi:DJ-1/PfpI family protein [Mucilaginibacter xinganensis]|uniref:DJ-1/PfpI family protein n=1 Tax=Mucilaginibacter xinganensis TaxID=1234841 RepID=A0A223NR89_9SPHI|nr:DJ-1/PfpI family protein [Mucilaginibacter xinganensis]ASU32422.1 DJ-1/PfpI family protein [Mucilaginibacter xinganensis]